MKISKSQLKQIIKEELLKEIKDPEIESSREEEER